MLRQQRFGPNQVKSGQKSLAGRGRSALHGDASRDSARSSGKCRITARRSPLTIWVIPRYPTARKVVTGFHKTWPIVLALALLVLWVENAVAAKVAHCFKDCRQDVNSCLTLVPKNKSCTGTRAEKKACRKMNAAQRKACRNLVKLCRQLNPSIPGVCVTSTTTTTTAGGDSTTSSSTTSTTATKSTTTTKSSTTIGCLQTCLIPQLACPGYCVPTTPTGLTATAVSCGQINLSWTASTDTGGSGLKGYNIYRGGVFLKQVSAPATSTSDTGLAASTVYSYAISAVDNAGNQSALSAPVTTNTPACGTSSTTTTSTTIAATTSTTITTTTST